MSVGTPPAPETEARPTPPPAPSLSRRRSLAGVVFRKELKETFRDKRTVFAVVISPLLITPLLLGLVGSVVKKQVSQARKETLLVGTIGLDRAPTLNDALKGAPNLQFEPVTEAEAERRIQQRDLRAALVFPQTAEQDFKEHREVQVKILLDEGNDISKNAAERLRELFEERARRVVALRLMEQGLSSELAKPFNVLDRPISAGGTSATMMLAMFLPYVLVVSAIMGGVYAASDMVAGEKERGTLEALLVSPASRRDLVVGKFFAVATASLVSSFLSVVGLLVPFYFHLPGLDWMAKSDLKLSAVAIAAMLIVQIPLAVLGAGLLLTVSTFSRNQKEVQSYLSPVLLSVTVLAMLSTLIKTEVGLPLALVPVLNAAMGLKQALSGSINVPFLVVAFVASMVYACLAMAIATHLFEKESVLLKA
jgi:sodium transport system permease protein